MGLGCQGASWAIITKNISARNLCLRPFRAGRVNMYTFLCIAFPHAEPSRRTRFHSPLRRDRPNIHILTLLVVSMFLFLSVHVGRSSGWLIQGWVCMLVKLYIHTYIPSSLVWPIPGSHNQRLMDANTKGFMALWFIRISMRLAGKHEKACHVSIERNQVANNLSNLTMFWCMYVCIHMRFIHPYLHKHLEGRVRRVKISCR